MSISKKVHMIAIVIALLKNNIISDVTKIIELQTFKTDSLKELPESLTWYKNETNVLK